MRFYKSFSIYFTFSIINASLTFLTSVYLARSLDLKSFGLIGLFLSILYFARPLASFNSIGLVSINKVNLSNKNFQIFGNNFLSFCFLLFLILTIIVFAINSFFEKKYLAFAIFLPFFIFIRIFGEFHNAELVQEHRSKEYGIYIFITRIFVLIISMIMISFFKLGWAGYLVALLSAEILVLFLRLKRDFKTLKNFQFVIVLKEYKTIFYFGLPLLLALIAGWGLNQADKFIVLHYFSLEKVAQYTVAYNLGVVINTINQALTNSILPKVYNSLKNGTGKEIVNKYTRYYILIIFLIVSIISFSSFLFIPMFYGIEFKESIPIVIFISIAFAFNGVYRVTGFVIEYYKKNTLKMSLLFVSFILNVGLSISLIQFFGILAPAIATVIAYIFLASSSQYFGRKILKERSI